MVLYAGILGMDSSGLGALVIDNTELLGGLGSRIHHYFCFAGSFC